MVLENYSDISKLAFVGISLYSVIIIISICFLVYARNIFHINQKGAGSIKTSTPNQAAVSVGITEKIRNQEHKLHLNKDPERSGLEEGETCTFDGEPCKHPYTCGYKPGTAHELHCRHCHNHSCTIDAEITECCHGYECVDNIFDSEDDHRVNRSDIIGVCKPIGEYPTHHRPKLSPTKHNADNPKITEETIKKHKEYHRKKKKQFLKSNAENFTVPKPTVEPYTVFDYTYETVGVPLYSTEYYTHKNHETLGAHSATLYDVVNETREHHLHHEDNRHAEDGEYCGFYTTHNHSLHAHNRTNYYKKNPHTLPYISCKPGSICTRLTGHKTPQCVPYHMGSEEYMYNFEKNSSDKSFLTMENELEHLDKTRDKLIKRHGRNWLLPTKPTFSHGTA